MRKLLFALFLLSSLTPTVAQATTTSGISCKANLSLQNGTRLNYTISGIIEFADDGQIINKQEPNLFVTIVRREPNGRERLLRSEEKLGNWHYDAPDADNRFLSNRFSESFKSSIDGLYYVRSADYGIYIGMSRRTPTKIQIVHFINQSNTRSVRSNVTFCSLNRG